MLCVFKFEVFKVELTGFQTIFTEPTGQIIVQITTSIILLNSVENKDKSYEFFRNTVKFAELTEPREFENVTREYVTREFREKWEDFEVKNDSKFG